MPDRITKALLALIAIALWGNLLRPLFTPGAVRAQQMVLPSANLTNSRLTNQPALVLDKNWVYVAADGYVTQFQRDGDGEMNQAGRSFVYPGKLAVNK